MEPTKELIDDIYRERVYRARRTPLADKLLAGPRIFDRVCRLMADGIRNENPGANDDQVRELLYKRLALLRSLREPR